MRSLSDHIKGVAIPARTRSIFLAGALVAGLAGCASTAPPAGPQAFSQALAASARQGNPRAELNYGVLLMQAAHSRRQRAAAVRWIQRAASANLASAQDRLGWLYLRGEGVRQSTVLALTWIRRAARRGAPAAQLQLGNLYSAGVLVPLDRVRAYYWYAIAARTTSPNVHIDNLAQVHAFAARKRQRLAAWLSPARRARIALRVANWRALPSVPYSGMVRLAFAG